MFECDARQLYVVLIRQAVLKLYLILDFGNFHDL
jgi:hypothetical protein